MIYEGTYHDLDAKRDCLNEVAKRNRVISRFHPKRWKAIYRHGKGWEPSLRPVGGEA